MNKSTERRTLAEILQEKITEKRTEVDTMYSDVDSLQQRDLDPRVVEMYQSVGKILSKYRSGKVPKAFKVIAQFKNWEDLLMLTEPGNILISREKIHLPLFGIFLIARFFFRYVVCGSRVPSN